MRLRHCPSPQTAQSPLPGRCPIAHSQTTRVPFKTDQRDARTIARLLGAGELTGVYIPEPTDEAIRDLCRARTDAVDDLRRCRLRLKAFLLRHGYRYKGKANWSQPHMRYLRELVLPPSGYLARIL